MTDPSEPFAAARRRQAELWRQLSTAPIVEVAGVVAPLGGAGAKSQGDALWTFSFTFDAWRVVGENLQSTPLRVQSQVSDDALTRLRGSIQPYAVLRIRARVSVDAQNALLEEIVGPASDEELGAHADRLQQPVIYEDGEFGTFTLDRRFNSYTGNVTWNGKTIQLTLDGDDSYDPEPALRTARSLWRDQAQWSRRICDFAVAELLPLKNDTWLEEDEAELTPDDFLRRMRLQSITVTPDGSIDFWHDDGDLFWGHSIQISGNLTEGPTSADIPG